MTQQFSLEVDLPSGRQGVYIAPLTLATMRGLYNGSTYSLPRILIDTLQPYVNVPIMDMYEEDFKFLLAWFDRSSYPESLRNYNWRCVKPYWANADGDLKYDDPIDPEFKQYECNYLNSEQVRHFKVGKSEFTDLPDGLHWPTVREWVDSLEAVEAGHSEVVADAAKWLYPEITSIHDRIIKMTYADMLFVRHSKEVCVYVEMQFMCNKCFRKYTHRAPLNPLKFLRVYSPSTIMDMAWNLTSFLDAYVPDDMPLMKFLYWHSCYVKDKNAAAERRALESAKRNGNRGPMFKGGRR